MTWLQPECIPNLGIFVGTILGQYLVQLLGINLAILVPAGKSKNINNEWGTRMLTRSLSDQNPMHPIADFNGHDAPWLVDELAPGITAMTDDILGMI